MHLHFCRCDILGHLTSSLSSENGAFGLAREGVHMCILTTILDSKQRFCASHQANGNSCELQLYFVKILALLFGKKLLQLLSGAQITANTPIPVPPLCFGLLFVLVVSFRRSSFPSPPPPLPLFLSLSASSLEHISPDLISTGNGATANKLPAERSRWEKLLEDVCLGKKMSGGLSNHQ